MTVRYLTPHSKWSIHSEYQDNLLMLSLSRGGPTVWMSPAGRRPRSGSRDNDWVECVNTNGVLVAAGDRQPPDAARASVYVHHAQERTIDVPKSEATGRRGGIHNSVTRLLVKPTHLIGGYAQLSYAFNYLGPTGNQRDMVTDDPPALPGGDVLMRVMAQMGMVMNLDKCIGCHTCSVTCKQAWTNRAGTEYVWFNNVETRPGQGYPRRYEDQERWKGGWALNRRGRLKLKAGGRVQASCCRIFASPVQPELKDYYEPWTYDYETLVDAPLGRRLPGGPAEVAASPARTPRSRGRANWDDNLGGATEMGTSTRSSPRCVARRRDKVRFEYEQTFMFYLPRICEHCLNPSCMASCPSGAIYKRSEDGIVLVDQDRCRGWRQCITGCPYKKIYFNHNTGKAEKCTFCYPRIEVGLPTVCSETCVGRLRYLGLFLYDADRVTEAAADAGRAGPVRGAAGPDARPERPGGDRRAPEREGIPDDWIEAARRSPVYALAKRYRVALPLHPEYRTMPMVWYVPPLSPVVDALARQGHDAEDVGNLFGAIDALRIPVEYLAELFTAGDTDAVTAVLQQARRDALLHARRHAGRAGDESIAAAVGMTGGACTEMYRLLAIAKYDDRYVIPTATPSRRTSSRRSACSPRLRRRSRDARVRPVRRGARPAGAGRGRDLPRAQGAADRPTTVADADQPRRAGQPAELGRQGRARWALPAPARDRAEQEVEPMTGRADQRPVGPAGRVDRCLRYPDAELLAAMPTVRAALDALGSGPRGRTCCDVPRRGWPMTAMALQEHYVETLDRRRRCCLYLTWWTEGETRRRGWLSRSSSSSTATTASSSTVASCRTSCRWCWSSRPPPTSGAGCACSRTAGRVSSCSGWLSWTRGRRTRPSSRRCARCCPGVAAGRGGGAGTGPQRPAGRARRPRALRPRHGGRPVDSTGPSRCYRRGRADERPAPAVGRRCRTSSWPCWSAAPSGGGGTTSSAGRPARRSSTSRGCCGSAARCSTSASWSSSSATSSA